MAVARVLRLALCGAVMSASGACSGGGTPAATDASARSDGGSPVADAGRTDGAAADAGTDGPVGDATNPADVGTDAGGDAGTPDGGEPPRIWVVVMAGQSNMVGLGKNADLTPAQAAPVPDATIYYNPSVHPNPNGRQWLPLGPGFGVLADRFGPELGFGRRWRELFPGRRLAIIKVAEGATALADRWKATTGDLYQLLKGDVLTQMGVLATQGRPQIVGFIWMQGESDGTAQDTASAYQANLMELIYSLRSDFGVALMPMVAGLIATEAGWPYANYVRNFTALASVQVGQMEVVETDDLPMWPDELAHYDSAGLLTLGTRFADASAGMLVPHWQTPGNFGAAQGDFDFTYRDRSAAGLVLATYDGANARWAGAEAGVLVGDGWMHPGTTHQAELGWWAPFAGLLAVTVNVSVPDTRGDGTVVEIADGAGTVWGPVAVPAGGTASTTLARDVVQGQELYFRTSSGPAGDLAYDTTAWTLDISMSVEE